MAGKRIPGGFCAILATTVTLAAQVVSPRSKFEEFEVASIKPTPPGASGRWIRMEGAHQFAAKNHALKTLIAAAFNVSPQTISGGQSWVDSDRFDILAKTPNEERPNLTEQMTMLRQLLADRFQLAIHREPKKLSLYAITLAKGGPKLKAAALSPEAYPAGPPPLIFVLSPALVRLPARCATIADLASVLQRAALDRPVVDRSGLTARYDFDLEFTPDETQFGGILSNGTAESDKPGLSAAIQQQLGLRLESTKGLVDGIVIDRVRRPSAN